MDSSTVLRSFQLSTVSHAPSLLERPCMVTTRKLSIESSSISGKLISSSTKRKGMPISCLKTPETTQTIKSSDNVPQRSLGKISLLPNGFEDLLLEVCDETEVAELKVKIGSFEMHMKRDIGAMKAPESRVSPTIAPSPVPDEPITESSPEVTPPSSPKPSSASMNPFKDDPEKKSPKLLAFEASGVTGYVLVPTKLVGTFQRGRVVKGRKLRPVLREGDFVQEGEVIGYVDQFGSVLPVRSDKDGEIIKYLLDDDDAVGYGDPVLALLPSFHSIN